MDYTTLIADKATDGSIKNWVNRPDMPASTIIAEAEAWLWEEGGLRAREMMTNVETTIDSGSNTEALASDFLDPIRFLPHGWGAPLPYVLPSQLPDLRDADGDLFTGSEPTCWSVVGTDLTVDLQVTANFSGMLMYYARPAELSVANTTNFVTTRWPALFRHVCMAKAYNWLKDKAREQDELANAAAMIERIKQRNDLYLRGVAL